MSQNMAEYIVWEGIKVYICCERFPATFSCQGERHVTRWTLVNVAMGCADIKARRVAVLKNSANEQFK